jgi:hypothetical protein
MVWVGVEGIDSGRPLARRRGSVTSGRPDPIHHHLPKGYLIASWRPAARSEVERTVAMRHRQHDSITSSAGNAALVREKQHAQLGWLAGAVTPPTCLLHRLFRGEAEMDAVHPVAG